MVKQLIVRRTESTLLPSEFMLETTPLFPRQLSISTYPSFDTSMNIYRGLGAYFC